MHEGDETNGRGTDGTLFRQPVERRRLDDLITVGAGVGIAPIVGHAEQNVRPLVFRSCAEGCAECDEDRQPDGSKRVPPGHVALCKGREFEAGNCGWLAGRIPISAAARAGSTCRRQSPNDWRLRKRVRLGLRIGGQAVLRGYSRIGPPDDRRSAPAEPRPPSRKARRMRVAPLVLLAFLASLVAPATAAAQAPAAGQRPNILFIIFDDWNGNARRGVRLLAGSRRRTSIASPARESCSATAFTSNPKCSPCRASILTGRNTWQLEEAVCHNGIFPSQVRRLSRPARTGRLHASGLPGKGWGPGDFKTPAARTRNPAGPSFDKHTHQAAAHGVGQNDYAAQLRKLS